MNTGQVAIEHNKPLVKAIAAAVAGNALEFYNFIIYSFFAVYIAQSFFPSTNNDKYTSLFAAGAVYGVCFFVTVRWFIYWCLSRQERSPCSDVNDNSINYSVNAGTGCYIQYRINNMNLRSFFLQPFDAVIIDMNEKC